MPNKTATLANLSSIKTEKKSALTDHPYHEMVQALQTTLDVEQLLDIFSEHVQHLVPHKSYSYFSPDGSIEVNHGKRDRHRCAYNLVVEKEALGELRMSRGTRFSEMELATLEAFLCRLLYPLRNSLHYRKAVDSAYLDPLTQTRNRGALMGSFQREWELARRHNTPLSVILLDIDHFKRINDSYGHDRGDGVLKAVAGCLKQCVRASDIVFRYGGEEFVILLSNTPDDGAYNLAERIRHTLESMACEQEVGIAMRITASFGVATLANNESRESLMKRADLAMYRAKSLGRNQVAMAE